jgi:hypothetical protein
MDNNAFARAWRECVRQLRWTRTKTRNRALLWMGDHQPRMKPQPAKPAGS